jgi:hypothetical protein
MTTRPEPAGPASQQSTRRGWAAHSPFGWHLNVRAPDNIAVELLAMKPEASAALYG